MLTKELNYDFLKRLLVVHQPGRFDRSIAPEEDEYVFRDGVNIILPACCGEIIETAARDFVDYLFTSMDTPAMLVKTGETGVRLAISHDLGEANERLGYRITVDENICIEGYDERGVAQGLYHLEDIMNLRRAPYLKKGVETRRTLLVPRRVLSGYGIDEYPDAYLSALAHAGITGLMLWIRGINESLKGYLDFNDLALRARKYGLDIYVEVYLHLDVHPDDEGAQEFYDNLYGELFRRCPYIKGAVIEGEACYFESRDPEVPAGVRPGWWPCRDFADLLVMIQKSIHKYSPNAELILCSYNWGWAPEDKRVRLINLIPADVILTAGWEMFEHYSNLGFDEKCADYSLRVPYYGSYFKSEAEAAVRRGIMMQTIGNNCGRTWDCGTIPYMPAPYQWIKRFEKMREAYDNLNLRGSDESIHYGVYPSIITELAKWALTKPYVDLEDLMRRIIISHYGETAACDVEKALRLWSDAYDYSIPTDTDQYGALRTGPAYPFYVERPVVEADAIPPQNKSAMFKLSSHGMINFYQTVPISEHARLEAEYASQARMCELLREGCAVLDGIRDKNEELERLANLGHYLYHTTVSGLNHKRLVLLRMERDNAPDPSAREALKPKFRELLLTERANAEAAIRYAELDSVLGFEPSMEYIADPAHIEWKLAQIDRELEKL